MACYFYALSGINREKNIYFVSSSFYIWSRSRSSLLFVSTERELIKIESATQHCSSGCHQNREVRYKNVRT